MGKCPFWSTKKSKIECYKECPMLMNEYGGYDEEEQCIFKESSISTDMTFKDIIKEDYGFLNLSNNNDREKYKIRG